MVALRNRIVILLALDYTGCIDIIKFDIVETLYIAAATTLLTPDP